MPRLIFERSFVVKAPLARVAAFHRDTRVLRRLTPPPVIVQLHHSEPLRDGAVAEFTLWFGPLPVRWRALHSEVDEQRGFTDTQVRGPLRFWQHRHAFQARRSGTTLITDRIEYEHHPGVRGWLSRVLFGRLALRFNFAYRAWITRRAVEGH